MNLKKYFNSTIYRYYAFDFFSGLVFYIAVLVPFYTSWGNLSLTQVALLQSWFMIWAFIMEIPTGVIADYFGRKYSVALGALVIAFTSLIYGSFPNFEVFLLCEFLLAVGYALMSGANTALLYDSLKELGLEHESKKIFGISSSIGTAGGIIALLIGSFVAGKFGLNMPMILTSIPFFIAAVIAWTIKEPKFKEKISESKQYLNIVKTGFVFLYHHKSLKILIIDGIAIAASAYFLVWLYQPLLQSVAFPIIYFGFIRASLSLSQIAISTNFNFFEKIFGSTESFLKYSALIVALSFLLVAIFPNLVTIIIFVAVGGGFGVSRLTLIQPLMNNKIPSEQRATILSAITMFTRLTFAVLNPLVGFVADHSLRLSLIMVGILPLAVFFFSPLKQKTLDENSDID
jgi:MFS family permease